MIELLTGMVLGAAGSGHCAVMCGPLVLTIGRRLGRPSRREQLTHTALYHGGRVLTYVALGIPAGLAGTALAVGGLGRILAVAGGLLLLAGALATARPPFTMRPLRRASLLATTLAVRAQRWAAAHPAAGPALTGAANGLLPCGLVYAAVGAAAASGGLPGALLVMLGFGLGTTPALAALSLSAATVPATLRTRLRWLTPAVLILAAALLFARAAGMPAHGHASERPADGAVVTHQH